MTTPDVHIGVPAKRGSIVVVHSVRRIAFAGFVHVEDRHVYRIAMVSSASRDGLIKRLWYGDPAHDNGKVRDFPRGTNDVFVCPAEDWRTNILRQVVGQDFASLDAIRAYCNLDAGPQNR